MRPLSISTALFDGYPMADALAAITQAGFTYVEPAFIKGYVDFDESAFAPEAAKAAAHEIRRHGLSVIAMSAHVDFGAEIAVEMVRRRVAYAATIGARFLITNTTTRDRADAFRRNLDAVLPDCERSGIVLALENPGHGRNDLIGNGVEGVTLVQAIGSDWVRLNYDFGNIFTYSHEAVLPEKDFAAALPWMAHGHLKDVRATEDGWTFTPVGDGSIRYDLIAPQLARLAPELPVSLELPLRLRRPGRRDPIRERPPLDVAAISDAITRSVTYWRAIDRLDAADHTTGPGMGRQIGRSDRI
ncbi:sugar phosphate isomerase/epimerase family protein [Bauldia sp.]|uniref:sugar phosphate isomerase/epimerase family protein n=1 Tax=Bauldia sp. TaxID=2575872 RepID=UPI003BAB5708